MAVKACVEELVAAQGATDLEFCAEDLLACMCSELRGRNASKAVEGLVEVVGASRAYLPLLRRVGGERLCAELALHDTAGAAELLELLRNCIETASRTFYFGDLELVCDLGQFGSVGVGWKVWPSAQFLASWLAEHPEEVVGCRVLEVGAGPGLTGLVAAKLGAQATLTDSVPALVALLAANAAQNAAECETAVLDWEDLPAGFPRFEVVIGADVAYAQGGAESLPGALKQLLEPGGKFLGCCPAGRGTGSFGAFLQGMRELGFRCLRHEALPGDDHEECTFIFFEAPSDS